MAKVRMGMVGGGEGAFIGAIHRMAAALDGEIELVCGAFSSNAQRSHRSGQSLHLSAGRCYGDYQSMFREEALLPVDKRMQFVAIVTPNHLHLPVALEAIAAGFHVLSDKPATLSLAEALQLRSALASGDSLYGLTHTYSGYPMVKEARSRIASGELGEVRRVVVQYPQGWLATAVEHDENKQAAWRLDPATAGVSSCMGDIGVHAANLLEYITQQRIASLCADLGSVVDERSLDDDGAVLLRLQNGARGVLLASQIALGEENALLIAVYGDKASLTWSQQEPNTLTLKYAERPAEVLRAGASYLDPHALRFCRTPPGHPEGYIEAFANLYIAFAEQIRAASEGRSPADWAMDCPGIEEAVRGMAFIETAVAASSSDIKWHNFPDL
ncbi:MAG: Gfo/Idh/MocA family oxidoreductase [Halioglobus sp.]